MCFAVYSHGIIGPYFFENEEGPTEQWMQSGTKSYRKHFCTLSYIVFSKICCGSNKMEQQLTQQKFSMQVLITMIPGGLISRFGDITCAARSPDHAVPDYFFWGYVTNKVHKTRPANIAVLKQRNLQCIQRIPKEMLQSATTARVYWKTWWSPTKCHIQTTMKERYSHGHGMHPIVLIKCFRFVLKSYFISKTSDVFDALCNRRILLFLLD